MSYQVIARKYRPQRFEDVVGQEHVTRTLGNAIRSGRIAHAYLFCGPRGTGKTTIARIFAKALNCTGGPNPEFDDADPRCREIAEGRSLDVLEIDGASNNGVEQVRELRDTARFAPASSRFKIYIIDEVHMLTTAAFNALLKTLEEPPAHVKFLFATTDPEKVLPTILSRCQRFDLRRIPTTLIVRHLAKIAEAEGVQVDEVALQAIGRGADGGLRDAESTLDQLISFCGGRVEESDVLSMFGLSARAQVLALSRALLTGDAPVALRELNELARNGKDLGRLLGDLLLHFRNLLIQSVAAGDPALLEVSEVEAAELREQAALAPAEAVTRILEVLTAADGRLRDASARKIFLEVTLMKAIQARHAVSLDHVLRQLQRLREEGGGPSLPAAVAPSGVAPAASPVVASSPPPPSLSSSPGLAAGTAPSARAGAGAGAGSPASAPAAAAPSAEAGSPEPAGAEDAPAEPAAAGPVDAASLWAQVVAMASPLTRGALQAGRPVSYERGILTIGYPPSLETQRSLVDAERTRAAIGAKLSGPGRPVTVRFVRLPAEAGETTTAPVAALPAVAAREAAPTPASAPAAPAAPSRGRPEKVVPMKLDPAEFKNDPLIREAIEVFRGQLVDIRGPAGPDPDSDSESTGSGAGAGA